ncbi:hypothetical protein U1Q18_041940, partial [Sarracenia purpurea var. burkii]
MRPLIRFTPSHRARRRIAGFVMPRMELLCNEALQLPADQNLTTQLAIAHIQVRNR